MDGSPEPPNGLGLGAITGRTASPMAANGFGVADAIPSPSRLIASECPTENAGSPFQCTGESDGEDAVAERGEGTCDLFSVGATIDVAESPAMGASECSASAFGGGTASALEIRLLVTAGAESPGQMGR